MSSNKNMLKPKCGKCTTCSKIINSIFHGNSCSNCKKWFCSVECIKNKCKDCSKYMVFPTDEKMMMDNIKNMRLYLDDDNNETKSEIKSEFSSDTEPNSNTESDNNSDNNSVSDTNSIYNMEYDTFTIFTPNNQPNYKPNYINNINTNKLSLLDKYIVEDSSDCCSDSSDNSDGSYDNDVNANACYVCKRTDVDIDCVCCDCSVSMCKRCKSHDGPDNYKFFCGCYGRCTNCKKKVDRCENGWPCGTCNGWYCSVKCLRIYVNNKSNCKECIKYISKGQEQYEKKIEYMKLQKNVEILINKHYELLMWQACKNIEYYIIKTVTNYDNSKMSTIDINLIKFAENNNQYLHKIVELMKDFRMRYYILHIDRLLIDKEKYTPKIVNKNELYRACRELEHIYNGIDMLGEYYNYYEDEINKILDKN